MAETENPKQKNETKKIKKKARQLLFKTCFVLIVGWLTLTFVFGINRLAGNYMYPALRDGDLCITYKIGDVYGGDVVAYETEDGIRLGRIIARSGDEIDGDEKGLILNGSPHSEEIFYPTQMMGTALQLPYTLGEGEYLVLNDYRSDLNDSRTYGIVKKDALKGKVIFIFRRRGF